MRLVAILKILGILLMIFSFSMLPPVIVGAIYHEGDTFSFLIGFVVTFLVGAVLWLFFRKHHHELRTRDGFLVVVLFWLVLSAFAAIPLAIALYPKMSVTNAMFESVSGLTTTGATVLSHLNLLPHALLYYRQQLHLLGGMGIIVLAVAVLPMLGVGGMQLYRAEVAGPLKTTKLTPRITQTAKALWIIYFGLALLCALCYWLAGMSVFDAVGESFTTVATGGFSLHDSSFAYYHSVTIDVIAMIFMILGATNFSLHFQFLKRRRLSSYYKDPEYRAYLVIILMATAIIIVTLVSYQQYHIGKTFLNTLFTAISLGSTTGLTTTNFSLWPSFLPFLVLFIAIVGGCGGSTSGGLKVIRALLLRQQGRRELNRLIHPKAVWAIKLGEQTLSESVLQAVSGFVAFFIVLFIALLLAQLAAGLNFVTAFGTTASCLSNTGASIGAVATSYTHIPIASKWICIFAMLAGRLEIFTIMVILMPSYWRS